MLSINLFGYYDRWKGENVATTEVAEVLNQFPGIQEANVYGVKIPGRGGHHQNQDDDSTR